MKDGTSRFKKLAGIMACVLPVAFVTYLNTPVSAENGGIGNSASGKQSVSSVSATPKNRIRDSSPNQMIRFGGLPVLFEGCKLRGADETMLIGFEKRYEAGSFSNEQVYDLAKAAERATGKQCARISFELYSRLVTSNHGPAFAKLANAYHKGIGVAADFGKAVQFYKLSARLGYANSAYRLIVITERGTSGIKGNPEQASVYLKEFLPLIEGKIRNGDAVAARSLARLYARSNALTRDRERARGLYRLAADLGDAIAMHDLALMIADERQDHDDLSDIKSLLEKSAGKGYPAAFTALGRMHLKALPGFDPLEAERWFAAGVEAGHPGAMEELARFYLSGEPGLQDFGTAETLARQGAALKHAGSISLLVEIEQAKAE